MSEDKSRASGEPLAEAGTLPGDGDGKAAEALAEPAPASPEPVRSVASGQPATPAPSRGSRWSDALTLALLVAVGVLGWQAFELRQRLAETQQELARRLAESDAVARDGRLLAGRVEDQLLGLRTRLGEFDVQLAESRSQQAALETLYQELARHRDEWAISEIEQSVSLAAQQLQLAGNVQGAAMALQAADARLAAATSPRLLALRRAFARDLDRLQALPQVDLPGMSLRLEAAVAAIDRLPLVIDTRPAATPEPDAAEAVALPLWKRMLVDAWSEIRALVRIQRFDRDEPALLAPGQVFFLRENLKLRLLNARLAMLMRDQTSFRNELKAAGELLSRHFDKDDPGVAATRETLARLSAAEVSVALPTLNESLSAIQTFKAVAGRQQGAAK